MEALIWYNGKFVTETEANDSAREILMGSGVPEGELGKFLFRNGLVTTHPTHLVEMATTKPTPVKTGESCRGTIEDLSKELAPKEVPVQLYGCGRTEEYLTPDQAFDQSGIFKAMVKSLEDRGFKGKVPKEDKAARAAFTKHWEGLGEEERSLLSELVSKEGFLDTFSLWVELTTVVSNTVR